MGTSDSTLQKKPKQTILVVDDAPMNRALLADMLGDDYEIIEAENGIQAVTILQSSVEKIALVLLDIVMPEMDGLEVLAMMNSHGYISTTPVIMVSSERSSSVIERAYALGATDFISRPFDTFIVRRRVMNTLMLYAKQRTLTSMIEDQIYERQKSVSLMVNILSQIVEFRNGESGMHVLHVNTITEKLLYQVAKKSGRKDLDPDTIGMISMASSLHDIGKMAIPEDILNKPGRLTDEEFELMKTHSAVGAEMLASLSTYQNDPLVQTAYEICRWHHERYDGRGYPDGLKGDEIPISAQVVSLADVYDALTSERVYKKAIPHEEALRMILDGECGAFDPFLLECLTDIADEIREELRITSTSANVLKEASHAITKVAMMVSDDGELPAPSSRTLDLLEYERMKFNFYAMMSNEIQFEYTEDPPLIVFADYGSAKLGLPEVISDPYCSADVVEMFGEENLQRLHDALRATTKDDPIVQLDLKATVKGELRWFHVAARAMWRETKEGMVYHGSIGKMVDVHENRQRMTALEIRATHDSLTGLMHHDFARKLIGERMEERPESKFVLMIIDMDHFKDANDTYGHMFGDEVLKHLSAKLKDSVRDSDIVARVGGDEFLICMECDIDPEPLVARIFDFITGEYKGFPMSVSMGVVCVEGGDAVYDDVFKAADGALYEMKRGGRGGYVFVGADERPGEDFESAVSPIDR